MRYVILCFLVLNLHSLLGQVICDESQTTDLLGDYPPGCFMCVPFLGGNNIGYTPDDTIRYDFPCGKVENSVWYSFYSRDEGGVLVSVFVSQCNLDKGVELAIFDENLNRVSDCISIGNHSDGRLDVVLPARKLFHIMIDGIDGDECVYGLFNNLNTSVSVNAIRLNTIKKNFCLGAEVCFIRDRDFALEAYEWEIPIEDSLVSGGVNEEEVCLYFKLQEQSLLI